MVTTMTSGCDKKSATLWVADFSSQQSAISRQQDPFAAVLLWLPAEG